MSFVGKYVTFILVDGSELSGLVTEIHDKHLHADDAGWISLHTGWTVNLKHVAAAKWEDAKAPKESGE